MSRLPPRPYPRSPNAARHTFNTGADLFSGSRPADSEFHRQPRTFGLMKQSATVCGEPRHLGLRKQALLLPPGRNSVLIRLGPQGFHKDEIVGDWTVTVKAATLPIPYAEVMDDPLDQGLKERWFELEKDSTGQHSDKVWLSPMNCSLREWNANPNDKGLEQVFSSGTCSSSYIQ